MSSSPHHLIVDVKPSSSVEHQNVTTKVLGSLQSTFDYLDRVLPVPREHRDVDALTELFQLVYRRRPIGVGGNEHGASTVLSQMKCELAGRRGFPTTLKAHQHDHGRMMFQLQWRVGTSHYVDEFVPDDLYELLIWSEALENFFPQCFLLDVLDEILYNLVVDIGFEQRQLDLPHGLVDVLLRQPSLPSDRFKDLREFLLKTFEHGQHLFS